MSELEYEIEDHDDETKEVHLVTQSIGKSVRNFLSSCGAPLDLPLNREDNSVIGRSLMLLGKAVDDFEAALGYRERALTAQQGGDLIYIVVGIMEKFGMHADEVLACIHISNISRIDPATSRPYDQDEDTGAVLRGPNYLDPYDSIKDIVSRV